MPVRDRIVAEKAFATPEWHAASDALVQATGINVAVMDFGACDVLSACSRCGYCYLATDIPEPGPGNCFDECPDAQAGSGRVVCRAGLPALYAPVLRGERPVAHVVISGFVTSTRERRGLYEHLLHRNTSEDTARKVVRGLPVIARRQAEAYLQMAVASAHTVVEAVSERLIATERLDELRLFVTAGQQAIDSTPMDAGTLGGIVDEAVQIVGAEAGAILRAHGSSLEVTAHSEHWRGALGALVSRIGTACGRAYETKRTVVASAKDGGAATLAMPLALGERVLGVLEVRLQSDALPLPQDRITRLNRFSQFVAVALEREDERSAVDRAMSGYAQLNELAVALGGQTDIDGVANLLTSVIEKSFSFDVAGLVLSGWGRDRADVVVAGTVASADVEGVLGIASGRDVATDPYQSLRLVTHRGEVVEGPATPDWSVASVPLSFGDLTVGWVFVARGDDEHYSKQDAALLEGIAAHGGSAFGRAALFSRIRDDYAKTIAALSATLDLGERSTPGHAGRVMDYAMMIGQELDLGFEKIEQLRFSGLLHDIGKSGVPEEILLKPSKLTAEEFERVQRHAELGASIVEQIDFLKTLTPVILHHHERWDGKGYPHGLKGEEIPLLARILGVADSFDAMTSERAYAERLSIRQARTELEASAGTQFDPRIVAALFEALDHVALAGGTGMLSWPEAYARPDFPA